MATFQLISDLHLEKPTDSDNSGYLSYNIIPAAPYLLLAGDIGLLRDRELYTLFLLRHISRFTHIYLVLGNHEFYYLEYEEGKKEARQLENDPRLKGKVTVLQRGVVRLPAFNLTILGTTLLTNIPDAARDTIAPRIQDFTLIKNWDISKHNMQHTEDLEFIKREIAKAPANDRIMIITHYAPSVHNHCAPHYQGSGISNAFATEILGGVGPDSFATWEGRSKVNLWAYGHTHHCTDWRWTPSGGSAENGIRVVANQRGYVKNGRETGTGFNPVFTFEI